MKCCDRPATHSVKTLLDHPDIDVNIRDKVRPLIMRFFLKLYFLSNFVPTLVICMLFLCFLIAFSRTAGRRWTGLVTRQSKISCANTVSNCTVTDCNHLCHALGFAGGLFECSFFFNCSLAT